MSVKLTYTVTGKSDFSTANHVRAVIEDHSEGQKARNKANEIKLAEHFQELPKLDHRILLRMKNTGSWMATCGTRVTGKVLLDMELCDFLCACYNLTPPIPRKNVMVFPNTSRYVMHLISNTVDSSLHVTMKCVTSSSTSRNVHFSRTASSANPSSARATADITKRYVTGEEKRRLGDRS